MSEFDKVIGYEAIKIEVMRVCDLMRHSRKYKKLGVKTPAGILLHGEPGVGKTLMANCIIKESGRKTFMIRKNRDEGFVEYIKERFEEAVENAPSIVFLDDFDKFANSDHRLFDYSEYVTVQACMDDVKDKEVLVIATANDIYSLPKSLRRKGRFDMIVEMEMPRGKEAEEIIKYFLSTKKLDEGIDITSITRLLDGRTCAELESIVNEAGIYAGYEGRDTISEDDLIKACIRLMFDSPEDMYYEEEGMLNRIAVHEAGHILIEEIFNPGNISIVSIGNHAGGVGGVTARRPSDFYNLTYENVEKKVMTLLGGKAATEIVFGEIDMGTADDIKRAAEIVEDEITNTGYLDFRVYPTDMPTHEMIEKTQHIVREELMRLYLKAKQVVASNRKLLDEYTRQLVEKGTITYKDIEQINKWYLRLVG